MFKLVAGTQLAAIGLMVIGSQIFRTVPDIPLFLGGLFLAGFGAIMLSDITFDS